MFSIKFLPVYAVCAPALVLYIDTNVSDVLDNIISAWSFTDSHLIDP
jgi:hypothetical protein